MVRLLSRLLADQRIRFLLVGGVNTVVGYTIYAVLTHWVFADVPFGYLISLVISYVIAIGLAFVLYRRFVFPVKGNVFRDLIKFVSVYIVSIGANVLALPLLVEVAGLNPLLAQAIILVVTTVLSYVGHKYFSFRRPLEPAASAPETSGEPAPVSSVPETTQD